jgi:antagonist of KipI
MSVRVLRPGLLTTLQDEGRHGYQRIGLCPGGAMDPVALALANALVGNAPGEAALEITVIGPEVMFEQDTLVAVCGAEFQGGFPHNRPTLAPAGSRFSVGRAVRGARAYLAVAGGFAVEPVLGSRSTYLPGHFGGVQGRALKHGDVLPLREPEAAQRFTSLKKTREGTVKWSAPPLTLPDREPILVHVIDGQHFASFDASSQRACLGSVQVPPSGVPIALMADHQTTGGYPRIAEIASADVARLAQLAPGGKVHFARCSLEMAGELRKHARERLQSALRGIAWEYAKK